VKESSIEIAQKESLVWSLERGSRSGRVAFQFAKDFAGRS
jgi:predicted AAA+ superfamily ATPase